MSDTRTNLLNLSRAGVEAFFAGLGERRYRAEQVMKWIYHRGVFDFASMTDVGRALRQRLETVACVSLPEVVSERVSTDGTRSWVVRVGNGNCVETVLIPEGRRRTLCVSSQVGCALDCSFCSTGKQGFNGNLAPSEIVGQVLVAALALREVDGGDRLDGVTNVVLMGMGEPLLNFDAALVATDLMMDDLAFGLSKRRVTISTAGVVPRIREMIGRTDVSLAVSLHAPEDGLRDVLVPINRRYPIRELLSACADYQATLGEKRVVTFEYTLLRGVNDTPGDARRLIALLADFPCKVNLIPFNPFPGAGYERPGNARVRAFQTLLLDARIPTMLRTTRGEDIAAACGQLVGQVADRTRRRERLIAREPALAGGVVPVAQEAGP